MRTIEVKLYQYSELSEKSQECAREWYRKALADDDDFWSGFCIDDCKEQLKPLGFDIDKIYFSGFWSQGDGACFEGTWRASDVKAEEPENEELKGIAATIAPWVLKMPNLSFTVKYEGYYSHENCTEFAFYDDGEDMFENVELVKAARECMRWCYRELEKAYDYENSDEVVADNIEANEYEFLENGEKA